MDLVHVGACVKHYTHQQLMVLSVLVTILVFVVAGQLVAMRLRGHVRRSYHAGSLLRGKVGIHIGRLGPLGATELIALMSGKEGAYSLRSKICRSIVSSA